MWITYNLRLYLKRKAWWFPTWNWSKDWMDSFFKFPVYIYFLISSHGKAKKERKFKEQWGTLRLCEILRTPFQSQESIFYIFLSHFNLIQTSFSHPVPGLHNYCHSSLTVVFFFKWMGFLFFFNLYLFIYLFIYLFMAVLGLRFIARAFSSCGKWGPLFIAVCGPLTIVASLVAEHRLQMRRLSSCGSRV